MDVVLVMKKLILIIVGIIVLVIIGILSIKLFNLKEEINSLHEASQTEETGAILYDLSNTPEGLVYDNKIWVPNDVLYVSTCCMYGTTFASLKSVDLLKREVEKIFEEHYEVLDGKYYDALNDFTIIDYGIIEGEIMNYIWYTY